ncbi:hypothetical protein Q6282_27560, partial [Klebsiella pneumoniae]
SNYFNHVGYAVEDDVGSFGKLAVAWNDFVADYSNRIILTYQIERVVKLPQIVISLSGTPSLFGEPAYSEQVLAGSPGNAEPPFSHLLSCPV